MNRRPHGADVVSGANGSTVFHDNLLGRDGSANPFDGLLDDLRVYNRAVLPAEIEGMFECGP